MQQAKNRANTRGGRHPKPHVVPGVGVEGHRPACGCNPCKKARGDGAEPKRRAGFMFPVALLDRLEKFAEQPRNPRLSQAAIVCMGVEKILDELEANNP